MKTETRHSVLFVFLCDLRALRGYSKFLKIQLNMIWEGQNENL